MDFGTKGCMYCDGECNKECLIKQETIENDDTWSLEKAKEFALNHFKRDEKTTKKGIVTWESVLDVLKAGVEVGYKFGTKWQQDKNKFSEEEVESIWKFALYSAEQHDKFGTKNKSYFIKKDIEEFIEQFKKK